MIDPGETLGSTAQVAVALAGFAGVVVAFGERAVHEWSDLDKFRLRLLLTFSILPLTLSLAGLFLLTTELSLASIWEACSTISFLLFFTIALFLWRRFTSLSMPALRASGASHLVFYGGAAFGLAVTLLQLVNVFRLGTFWPFFSSITLALLASSLQFVRLVLHRRQGT